ncbi:hypothetical protein GGI26_005710 [Coemansia sp. RSA 1358]|nr:histidine phosphatase superfamily [Coemansia spiralis]KAJ1988256.1 hypothetical protein EDC05_005396 [Coemansia umbellata]KAJ2619603.1 hypothetical protein GGI26_005710 [Coemansia sp. RSA 1358]
MFSAVLLAATAASFATTLVAGAPGASAFPVTNFASQRHTVSGALGSWSFDSPAYTYCDPSYPSAESYNKVPDASLELVQMVVRHGDRSPVNLISHDDSTWDCNGVSEEIYLHGTDQNEKNTTGSFEQLIVIPSFNGKYGFSNKLWKGTCDVGELTDKGKSQHRLLGTRLRDIYVNKLGYLPDKLNHTNEIYVRTTYVWRTKNSAESLLGAMWPGREITPSSAIPLHTYPKEIETMYGNSDACPRIKELTSKIVASDSYQQFLKEQGPLMTRLQDIMGVQGSKWDNGWDGYFDALNARKCHGKKPICAQPSTVDSHDPTSKDCTTDEDVAQVSRNANYEWLYKSHDNPLAQNFTRLYIGSFVGTLRDQIAERIAGKTGNLKFALYSGHDSTVWPLLSVLDASDQNSLWPPYASNLIFELWKKNDGKHVIRVIFNGKTLELQKDNQWCDMNACPVDKFYNYLEKFVPDDITAECA